MLRTPIACSAMLLYVLLATACTELSPGAREHLRRGDAALAEGRYTQALAAYGHARELAPNDADVQRALMRVRAHLAAESAARISPEGVEDARYEAQLLLDTDKARAPVYLTALANVLVRQGDVEGAKVKLADALKADPASALAHTALGVLLMARSETVAQAKGELELALKAKPDHAPALVALGRLELAEGNLPSAVDRLQSALRAGDDFGARMALGRARAQQQRAADAAEQFQRAADLDPRSADALSALGQALLNAGRPDDAERALRSAMQLRADATTMVTLGLSLARQKKLEPALTVFSQVLEQDHVAAGALLGAGMVSEDLGKREQALAYYERLLALQATGRERQMLLDLQREAQSRATALNATSPSPSASGMPKPVPNGAKPRG